MIYVSTYIIVFWLLVYIYVLGLDVGSYKLMTVFVLALHTLSLLTTSLIHAADTRPQL